VLGREAAGFFDREALGIPILSQDTWSSLDLEVREGEEESPSLIAQRSAPAPDMAVIERAKRACAEILEKGPSPAHWVELCGKVLEFGKVAPRDVREHVLPEVLARLGTWPMRLRTTTPVVSPDALRSSPNPACQLVRFVRVASMDFQEMASRLPELRFHVDLAERREERGPLRVGRWRGVERIVVLDLSRRAIQDAQLAELAQTTHLEALEELYLDDNRMGDDGFLVLSTAKALPSLVVLSLARNRITDAGLEDGIASPAWRNLRALDLTANPIGDYGAADIARAHGLAKLEVLGLGGCGLSAKGVQALASSVYLRGVRHLDLSSNGLTDEAALVLAASRGLDRLESLDLGGNRIGLRGVRALMQAEHLSPALRLALREQLGPLQS